MIKVNIQTINDNGETVNEATLEGETLYFILTKKLKEDENLISFEGNNGFCGRAIPDKLIGDSWCKNIASIIRKQCDDKDLDTAFQLFNLSEMLRHESDELIDKIVKTRDPEKLIPKEIIDFIMRNR